MTDPNSVDVKLGKVFDRIDRLVASASTIIDRKRYDDLSIVTDGEPVHILRLFESKVGAGYYCTQEEGTTVKAHTHDNSIEHFIVLDGELHFNNGEVVLKAGDQWYFKPGQVHASYASVTTMYVCIIVPPEKAFLSDESDKI